MLVTILDGYVDEPSLLGVPPYISPYIRQVAGVCRELEVDCRYMTIDDWRAGVPVEGDVLVFVGGAIVPGKYLRTYPASLREVMEIAKSFRGLKLLGGGLARYGLIRDGFDFIARRDVDSLLYDVLTDNFEGHRYHTIAEWNRWLIKGAEIVRQHPDFPQSIIAEIETFRGCPRYITGGCSFCTEPLFGKPVFRDIDDIVREVRTLRELGVVHFRIGGQSCIYSYKAYGVGEKDVVQPNPGALDELFSRLNALKPKVLHVDNANPAVIASYPGESERITEILVKYTTPGNVLSFGMESADPEVARRNNLNATPEQVISAIALVNEIGGERGYNGMPKLLPGLNFICGLWGERRDTYALNFEFLHSVLDKGYLLRRINIRQIAPIRARFRHKYRHECWKFRDRVRREIDAPMLRRMLPRGTVLGDVYLEVRKGNYTYGRQIGSYPLVVVLPYPTQIGRFVDVRIFDYGERSVTGVEYPLDINRVSFSVLKSLPGIGDKRAAMIVRQKPFKTRREIIEKFPELAEFLDDGE